MTVDIYYFSGTGNTLFAARKISEKTGGRLIPIASLRNKKTINVSADSIGIIFPVYYTALPIIVKKFAEKLENLSDKYVFALATYGGSVGVSLKILNQIIRSRGGKLSAKFGIHLPQNAFYKSFENKIRVLKRSVKKFDKISTAVLRKRTGWFFSDLIFYLVFLPLSLLIKPLFPIQFAEVAGLPPTLPIEALIYNADKSFAINDKCTGCGICAKVCPVENIEIRDNQPLWLHHCENCLACYNWCPNTAITSEIAQKEYHYKNPKIKVSDMIL